MFEYTGEDNRTIIKISNASQFVDIREAFGIGRIQFQFRKYDKNKPSGQRTNVSIDAYLSISEFSYLCDILTDGSIARYAKKNEQLRSAKNAKYAEPAYKNLSGSGKDGKIVARALTIEKGSSADYIIKVVEGPGRKTDKGLISFIGSNNQYLSIGLSKEDARKLGLAGKRAVSIYDRWVADRVLDQRLAEIEIFGKDKQAAMPQFQPMQQAQPTSQFQQNANAAPSVVMNAPINQQNYQEPVPDYNNGARKPQINQGYYRQKPAASTQRYREVM